MKLTVLSESEADDAAVRVLIRGVLGDNVELQPMANPQLIARHGWPSVLQILPAVILQLYYRTDAEGLAVVVDSDDSPVHDVDHEEPGKANPLCRLCLLRQTVEESKSSLRPVAGRRMLKTALGLAVPSIEAWYRCGLDPHVNEATWARHLRGERITFTRKSLKLDAYGMDRAPLSLMTDIAERSAERLVADLESFEQLFPGGFGSFARELQSWKLR